MENEKLMTGTADTETPGEEPTQEEYESARQGMLFLEDYSPEETIRDAVESFKEIEAKTIEKGWVSPENSLYHKPRTT